MYTALSFATFKNHQQCFNLIYRHALQYNLAGGDAAYQKCVTEQEK